MQLFVEIKTAYSDLQFGTYSFSSFTHSNSLIQYLGPNIISSTFLMLLLASLANKKNHHLCNAVDKINKCRYSFVTNLLYFVTKLL